MKVLCCGLKLAVRDLFLCKKNVKITLFFPWCNLEGLDILLLLLNKEINLSMTVCKNALINPHVIEALRDEFKVEFIE